MSRWRKDRDAEEHTLPIPTSATSQLETIRQLAQKAAELGEQVERELAEHVTEGHPRRD